MNCIIEELSLGIIVVYINECRRLQIWSSSTLHVIEKDRFTLKVQLKYSKTLSDPENKSRRLKWLTITTDSKDIFDFTS